MEGSHSTAPSGGTEKDQGSAHGRVTRKTEPQKVGTWLVSESDKLELRAREDVMTAQLKKQRNSDWDWKGRLWD